MSRLRYVGGVGFHFSDVLLCSLQQLLPSKKTCRRHFKRRCVVMLSLPRVHIRGQGGQFRKVKVSPEDSVVGVAVRNGCRCALTSNGRVMRQLCA